MIFSLAPTLIIVGGLVAAVVGESAARGQLLDRFEGYFGRRGADVILLQVGAEAARDTSGVPMMILGGPPN